MNVLVRLCVAMITYLTDTNRERKCLFWPRVAEDLVHGHLVRCGGEGRTLWQQEHMKEDCLPYGGQETGKGRKRERKRVRNTIQPSWPGVVAHTFHLSTLETGEGGFL